MIWQQEIRTNSPIGEMVGLTGSAVSRRARVWESRIVNHKALEKKIAEQKSPIEI